MKERKVVPVIILLAAAMLFMTTPAAVQALETPEGFVFWFNLNPQAGGPKWFGTENVHWSPWTEPDPPPVLIPPPGCSPSLNECPADGDPACCAYNDVLDFVYDTTDDPGYPALTTTDLIAYMNINPQEWIFFVRIGATAKKFHAFSDVAYSDLLKCEDYDEQFNREKCELYQIFGAAIGGVIPLDIEERTFQEDMMLNYFKEVVLPEVNACGADCPEFNPQMKSVTRGVVKFDPPSFMMFNFEITERP